MTNHSQSGQKGRPLHQGGGFNLFSTPGDTVLTLGGPDAGRTAVGIHVIASLHMNFVGANPRPSVAGLEEVPGRFGELIGSDPTVPYTGIARYRKVRYFDIYPGIDLTYSASQRRLQSEFTINPGADPAAIRLAFRGIDTPRLDKQGNLILNLADREVVQKAPVTYQVMYGKRREVAVHLDIEEQGHVVTKVADYSRRQTLTVSMDFDYSKWSPFPIECDLGAGDGYFILADVKQQAIAWELTKDLVGPHGVEYIIEFVHVSALEAGLDNCPIVRDSIVWETGDGQLIPFTQWTPDQKQVLYDYYDQLMAFGETASLYIPCSDPKNNSVGFRLYLTANEAFSIYAAHVAWALYLEAKKLVPWSLAAQSKGGREEILASYRYHSRIKPSQQKVDFYPPHIKPDRDFQPLFQDQAWGVLRCDPRIGYWFVKGQSPQHPFQTENLLAASQEETLVKLTGWFRRKVAHGEGYKSAQDMLDRGVFLEDRLKAPYPNNVNSDRWLVDSVKGCHTASSLMYDLAKSVNIPLRHVSTLGDYHAEGAVFYSVTHGGLVYRWDTPNARVLYHTDNLYSGDATWTIFPTDGQGNPVSAEEADKKFFEAYWVPPAEMKSWGFEYKLELIDPQTAQTKFKAGFSPDSEDFYDYGYVAGYWLRSDRAMEAYADNEPVLNPSWRWDLEALFRLEQKHRLCNWMLVQYYAEDGENGKGKLEDWLSQHEEMKKAGFPSLHNYDDYWQHTKACVNAYGGGQAVDNLAWSWMLNRGYPK